MQHLKCLYSKRNVINVVGRSLHCRVGSISDLPLPSSIFLCVLLVRVSGQALFSWFFSLRLWTESANCLLFSGQYSSYSCLLISFGENEKDISLPLCPCISKDIPAFSPQGYGTSFHHCLLDPVPSWRLKCEARQPTSRPARSLAGPTEAVDIFCPCSSIVLPRHHLQHLPCRVWGVRGVAGAGRDALRPRYLWVHSAARKGASSAASPPASSRPPGPQRRGHSGWGSVALSHSPVSRVRALWARSLGFAVPWPGFALPPWSLSDHFLLDPVFKCGARDRLCKTVSVPRWGTL